MNGNSEIIEAPIFIVGAPRSGTTLAARILGKHSHIFMPGETHFFDDIYARRQELGEPAVPEAMERIIARLSDVYGRFNEPEDQKRIAKLFADPVIIAELKACSKTYKDLFSSFMRIQMRAVEKRRWGNNVPKDIFSIREIVSFYPHAKVIVCIRDIRDFLLSYRNKWRATSQEHVRRIQRLYHPVLTSLLWKSSVKQIAAAKSVVSPENLMIVKYESLACNPLETVQKICAFIGEDFQEQLQEVSFQNSSFQTQEKGIFSSSVGRWRKGLSHEEVYLAQKIACREIQQLGYGIEKVHPSPVKLIQSIATLPYALWRALDANRELRGPLLPYLTRRVAAFLS